MKSGTQRSLCLLRHLSFKTKQHTKGPEQASQRYNKGIPVNVCRKQAKGPASYVIITGNKQNHGALIPREVTKTSITKQPESSRKERRSGSKLSVDQAPPLDEALGLLPLHFVAKKWHREYLSSAIAKGICEEKEGTRCETQHHCCLEEVVCISLCACLCVEKRKRTPEREIQGPGSSTEPQNLGM